MTNLERAVKSGIRSLEKKVEKSIRFESYKTVEWHGRKVVSVEKWKNLSKINDVRMLIEHLPDEYFDYPFSDVSLDEKSENDLGAWFNDWSKYLHENRRTSFGNYQCRSCILHPKTKSCHDNTFDIVMKVAGTEYPCKVVNIYECPYKENEKDILALQTLKKIWEVTSDAISHNEYLTWNNRKTIFADFEKDSCEVYFDLHLSDQPNSKHPVDYLQINNLTKVPIESLNDLYNVLTDSKLLETVIDEYAHRNKYNQHSGESEIDSEIEDLKLIKKTIILYFVSIKDQIKLEELRTRLGKSFDDEKKSIEGESHYEFIKKRFPHMAIHQNKPKNGLCMDCSGFANILCVNCNKWICDIHWKEHKEKFHNKCISTMSIDDY